MTFITKRVVYCYTNEVDGKQYVGQTKCKTPETMPEQAIKNRKRGGYDSCLVFKRAIRKHGWGRFTATVLDVVFSHVSANESEAKWIAKLGTIAPYGYNIDRGGGVLPRHPDTGRRISKALRKNHTAEQRSEKSSKAAKAFVASTTHEQRSAKSSAALVKGWATRRADPNWKKKAKQRSELARKAQRALMTQTTHEQRSATARKRNEVMSPGQLASLRKMQASRTKMTPEQRSERSRRANAVRTKEERSRSAHKTWATRKADPNWKKNADRRSEVARKAMLAKSIEERRKFSRSGNDAKAARRAQEGGR